MIEVSKHDDNTYIAVMDIATFESYGLNVERIDERSVGVQTLIGEILEMIVESFGDFQTEVCGVGIMVDKNINKVSISIGENTPDLEILGEYLDAYGKGDLVFEDDETNTEFDDFNEYGEVQEATLTEYLDYSEGIIAELPDIESVIELAQSLKIEKEDNVSLYEDTETKSYYVVIDKTAKLHNLMTRYIEKDEEADVIDAIEYELSEEIYEEYLVLKSYFEEHGMLSRKKKGYLDDFGKLLIADKAFRELNKYFK